MLFSLLKHYLDTDTALKVSQSVYCFTTSISHGVENYFPRLWGTGISDAIFEMLSFCSLLAEHSLQMAEFLPLFEGISQIRQRYKCRFTYV